MATGSAIAFKLMTAPDVWDGGDGDQSGAGNPLMMYALILVLAFVMVAAVALVLLKQRIPKAPQ